MFIVVTKGELVKAGQWDEFCTIVGVDKGVDTGGAASNAPVFLTEEEAEKLGITIVKKYNILEEKWIAQ